MSSRSPLPPGPGTPAFWQLLQYSQSPLPFLESCARRFGDPFTVRFAGYGDFVMLSDPDAVRDVFRTDARTLHSGEANEFMARTLGPASVLVLDEDPHERQRRVLLPPMKGERMRSFFASMQRATLDAASDWPLHQPMRMLEPMQRITLRVIMQAVLGLTEGPELEDFEHKVRRLLALTRSRYSLILVKLYPERLLKDSSWLPFSKQLRDLDEALLALIARRRELSHDSRGVNVLADLLGATYDDGQPIGDREIRDAVVTMLIAGHDTTALAVSWALEQIVPRANIVSRLKEELRSLFGDELPTADKLHQMEYLDAAIRESLRIRTILPFVVRVTKKPFVAGGREYPPGIMLCPCSHLLHHRPDLYPGPEQFRPERFLERKYAGHEWFPFGGGNRTCLGMAFALYEMKVVLSTLFSRVELARPPGSRSFPVRRGVSLAPHDGAVMTLKVNRTASLEKTNASTI